MKNCTKCKDNFPIGNFYKDNRRKDKLTLWCKSCCDKKVSEWKNKNKEQDKINHQKWYQENKEKVLINTKNWRLNNLERYKKNKKRYSLKKKYSISIEEYEKMLIAHNNKCAICKKQSKNILNVDHNHKTNEIRGLLCTSCNTALGGFKDSIELLQEAINYIIKF